jgi:hypothetical protein
MGESVELQVARIVDREALVEVLRANGIESEPIEEGGTLGVRVPCADGDSERACEELLAQLEQLVAGAELPLVPQRGDGFIFLRPPGD